MKKMTRLSSLLVAAGLTLGLAHSAQALTTSWTYENEDGFIAWTDTSAGGTEVQSSIGAPDNRGLPSVAGTATRLSWDGGTEGPQAGVDSAIHVESLIAASDGVGKTVGTVFTGGAWADGVPFTHDNFVIPIGPDLATATLRSSLRLTPLAPPGPAAFPAGDPISFFITFTETTNFPNGGVCADGSPTPLNGCPDILVLLNPDVLVTFISDGDQLYKVTINPDSAGAFGTLDDGECAAAGAEAGCQGWITTEAQSNTLQPQFRIDAVPEPASLALMGLGLLGLAAIRRRKQA